MLSCSSHCLFQIIYRPSYAAYNNVRAYHVRLAVWQLAAFKDLRNNRSVKYFSVKCTRSPNFISTNKFIRCHSVFFIHLQRYILFINFIELNVSNKKTVGSKKI